MKIEEVPFVDREEVDASLLEEEDRLLNEMEQAVIDDIPKSINTAIDEFSEYPKDPEPVKKKPEPKNAIRKISVGSSINIKKLLHDAILTRKVPPPAIPMVPEEPKRSSFIERKFGSVPVDIPETKTPPPPVQQDINPFQMDLNPKDQDVFLKEPIIKTRTKPLPPVVMPKRQTFLERILSIKLFSKFTRRAKSKVSSKRRDISTGMTARQRIKRYNSIHEGGYGAPKEDESAKAESPKTS